MLSSLNDGCYRVAEEKERGNGLFIRVIERRPVRLRGSQRRLLRSAVLFSSSSSSSFFFLSVSGSVFFVFSLLASLACSLFDLIFWFLLAVAVVCCDGVWLPSCDLWRRRQRPSVVGWLFFLFPSTFFYGASDIRRRVYCRRSAKVAKLFRRQCARRCEWLASRRFGAEALALNRFENLRKCFRFLVFQHDITWFDSVFMPCTGFYLVLPSFT